LIRIEDRVWAAWREAGEEGDPASILMKLSLVHDGRSAVRDVRESVFAILEPHYARLEASREHDPARPGEWEWLGMPDGVLLLISDCDLFEEMMGELVAGLQCRGIEGVLDVHDWPRLPPAPAMGHILSCHLRVRGRRTHEVGGNRPVFMWRPDLDAHGVAVAAVERWCKQLGGQAAYEIRKSTIGPFPIDFHDDATLPFHEAFTDNGDGELRGATGEEWRQVGVSAYVGGIGLAIGSADLDVGTWRTPLEELTTLLRDNADALAYAYVRRSRMASKFDDPLDRDWPPRPGNRPRGGGFTDRSFEDVFAPDAFAVQLLGEGYAGRIPDTIGYRREEVGEAGTLLEHVDLPAWFDAPFVPDGRLPDPAEPPPVVLADARAELEPILYRPGALHQGGHTDSPDL
jgi:hypothetical protein